MENTPPPFHPHISWEVIERNEAKIFLFALPTLYTEKATCLLLRTGGDVESKAEQLDWLVVCSFMTQNPIWNMLSKTTEQLGEFRSLFIHCEYEETNNRDIYCYY